MDENSTVFHLPLRAAPLLPNMAQPSAGPASVFVAAPRSWSLGQKQSLAANPAVADGDMKNRKKATNGQTRKTCHVLGLHIMNPFKL